jgi:hypothetical protein
MQQAILSPAVKVEVMGQVLTGVLSIERLPICFGPCPEADLRRARLSDMLFLPSGSHGEETKSILFIPEMAELFLGKMKFAIDIVELAANCPKFQKGKLLADQIESPASHDSNRIFVSLLRSKDPSLTIENMNDISLLCEECRFAVVRSKISEFELRAAVVNDKARRRHGKTEEQKMQRHRTVCFLQKDVAKLWRGCSNLGKTVGYLRESNGEREREMEVLWYGNVRISEENRSLRAELARFRQKLP